MTASPTAQNLDISFSLEAGDWEAVVTDVEMLVEAAARAAFEARRTAGDPGAMPRPR